MQPAIFVDTKEQHLINTIMTVILSVIYVAIIEQSNIPMRKIRFGLSIAQIIGKSVMFAIIQQLKKNMYMIMIQTSLAIFADIHVQ